MLINNKQYLYDTNNYTINQESTTINLEIHNNEQTNLRKTYKTNNKIKESCINQKQIARKKPGFDSQLNTCYCGFMSETQKQYIYLLSKERHMTINNKQYLSLKEKTINNKQYLYSIKNDTGSQGPKNRNLEIHNNKQTELKKISQTNNYVNNTMADYLGINLQVARLLGQIYQDQRVKKYCYSSNRRLSYQCNISERSVTNYIKKLQELGMIHSEVKKIHKNRKVKSERTILLTNEFYEVAERCACKPINRINKWEIARKPNKISKSQTTCTNNKYISKDIYKERRDTTVEVKPKKKELLKTYNLLIKEYVNLNFSSDKGLESLLKRFVRVQFKRNRRNDKNWFMLNDELKDHLDELLKLSKGCLLSACAIARLTVVQEWGKFYPLTKKKALHVDKFLQERIKPLFNQVRAYYNEIYGVQSIEKIYGINDEIVKEHKRFEDELSEIKTIVRNLRKELNRRNSLGICDQTNQGTILIKKKREETWEEKYGCMNAVNSIEYIDISPETGKLGPTCDENIKGNTLPLVSGSAPCSASKWHL